MPSHTSGERAKRRRERPEADKISEQGAESSAKGRATAALARKRRRKGRNPFNGV